MPELAVPEHDDRFAISSVLDPGPIGSAESSVEVRPGFGEEMIVNVDSLHV
jgi:hypothetical protein